MDLDLGCLAAQIVHAAGESSPGNLPEGTNAVVLAVRGEQELLALEQRLLVAGVQHVAVREPDRGGELMTIGIVPGLQEELKRHFSSLPLLRKLSGM